MALLTGRDISPTTGTVLLVKFEQETGESLPSEGGYGVQAEGGTGTEQPTIVSGRFGNALYFDGNDYVELAHSTAFDLSTELTIEQWVKTTTTDGGDLFTKDDNTSYRDYRLSLDLNGKVEFALYSGGTEKLLKSNRAINDGKWHHIIGRYKKADGIIDVWIDGKKDNSDSFALPVDIHPQPIRIGMRGDGSYGITATIDSTALWSIKLSDDEIIRHARAILDSIRTILPVDSNLPKRTLTSVR